MKKNLPAVRKSESRRILAVVLACMAALALMVPAFAHGHGNSGGHHGETHHEETHVSLCNVPSCQIPGQHVHDGVTYCGNHHEEGYCLGNCAVYSETHISLCGVQNCWLPGQHVHDGVTYCGNHHAEGYCTGNCTVSPAFAMHHHGSLHGSHHH